MDCIACYASKLKSVRKLLEAGASIDIKDREGILPVELTNDDAIVQLFAEFEGGGVIINTR